MLKIIGIVLLVLLGVIFGLLLAAFLAVLFVPVRYRIQGEYHNDIKTARANAAVTWLLHALAVRGSYCRETGLILQIKVLGFTLWEQVLFGPEEEKENAPKEKENVWEKASEEPKQPRKQEDEVPGAVLQDVTEEDEQDIYRQLEEDEAQFRRQAEERVEKQGDDVKEADCQPETSPHGRIGRLLAKIRALAGKIQALPGKLQFSFYSICDKLKNGKNLVTEKKAWLEDEKNQASIRLVLKQAKRLLIHVMPGKGKGSLTFGFEDPYTTGQVLEAFSLIYPFCHRHFTIHPVFDEKILEAEGALRGRVRAGYILWLAIGILKDKHTRRLIRGFLK